MRSFSIVLFIIMTVILVGCNPICELAKTGTNLVAQKIATRWECDQSKLYDFMIKPTSKYVCKENQGEQSALDLICPIATGFLVDLGEAEIVARFSCDPTKVRADLNNADKLCDLLNQ